MAPLASVPLVFCYSLQWLSMNKEKEFPLHSFCFLRRREIKQLTLATILISCANFLLDGKTTSAVLPRTLSHHLLPSPIPIQKSVVLFWKYGGRSVSLFANSICVSAGPIIRRNFLDVMLKILELQRSQTFGRIMYVINFEVLK
jgi:hypothetical protein